MFATRTKIYLLAGGVLATMLTMSTFHFMLLFWTFFAGVAVSVIILRPGYEVPNLLLAFRKSHIQSSSTTEKISQCSVCGKVDCKRQRPEEQLEALQPWVDIQVNEKVDNAVTEFLEILLEKYIQNWYQELSENEDFLFELRRCLRHCLSVLYLRINKLDLPEVIIKKLLKVAIFHLNICLTAQQKGYNSEEEVLLFYGSKMHMAMQSRRAEVNYLRGLCDCLLPLMLPPYFCKSMIGKTFLREVLASNVLLYGIDSIEDPDRINLLLLIFFDESAPKEATEPPSQLVPFLAEFTSVDQNSSNSHLHIDLPKIINTQELLYQFMMFLKTIDAVHYLQFCLTVDDFNRRCLAPEQNETQQKRLHEEARSIYFAYCVPDSPTFIHFHSSIIEELKEIANGKWDEVCRLRTSTPLFQAYDHVYNLLEQLYCPMFYQSDSYYEMLCGKRAPYKKKGKFSRQMTRKEGSVKQADKKAKESPKPNRKQAKYGYDANSAQEMALPDDGCIDDADSNLLGVASDVNPEDEVTGDGYISRDLSAWRIEIPRVENREEEPKTVYYCVEVKRVNISVDDEEPEQWHVLRRYTEFYVLESKLTEFHGSLATSLPPKKLFSPSSEFLTAKKSEFERFLKTLVSKPALRHSELLYDFLLPSRAEAVSKFERKSMPDVKIGKFFRRVPNKLLKEKGQHLEGFLASVSQACETPKPKPGNYEPMTDNPEIQMDHKIHSELYPESDWQFDSFPATVLDTHKKSYLTGVSDYLIYLAVRVFEAGELVHRVMVAAKTLFKNTLEPFASYYLKQKIDQYRQEHHVVELVQLFRDIVFFSNEPPRTQMEKRERRNATLKAWKNFVPAPFVKLVGKQKRDRGCEQVFEILQKPKLNKQLGYMLLDTVVLELFPELRT